MATQRRLVEAVEVTDSMIHIIRLKDIFDASTVNEFEKVISFLLAKEFYKIVVDLGRVAFISSAGWGAFTAELRRVRQNHGDIKLANLSHDVFDVFLLLELDSFIQAYESAEEAITAFASRTATFVAVEEPSEPAPPPIIEQIRLARSRATAQASVPAFVEAEPSAFMNSSGETDFDEQRELSMEIDAVATEDGISALADAGESEDGIFIATPSFDEVLEEEQELAEPDDATEVQDKFFAATPGGENQDEEQQEYGVHDADEIQDDRRVHDAGEFADENTRVATNREDEFAAAEEYAAYNRNAEVEFDFSTNAPNGEGEAEEPADYSGDGDILENDADLLKLPTPAASGPEMWELLIANDKAVIDPYMFKSRSPLLLKGKAGEDAGKSKAENFGTDQRQEDAPESGSEFYFSGHEPILYDLNTAEQFAKPDASLQAGFAELEQNQEPADQEEFTELISETGLGFSQHKLIANEQSSEIAEAGDGFSDDAPAAYLEGAEAFSGQMSEPEAGFDEDEPTVSAHEDKEFAGQITETAGGVEEYAPMSHSREEPELTLSEERNKEGYIPADSAGDAQFDEFETQDIRDPWILEEIDTFPEEYELCDNTSIIEEESRIAAAKFWSDGTETEAQMQDWTPNHESQDEARLVETETELIPPAESGDTSEPEADDTDWGAGSSSMQNDERQAIRNAGERQTVPTKEFLQPKSLADILPSEGLLSGVLQEEEEAPFAAEVESVAVPAVYDGASINEEMMELIRDIVAAYPHYGPAMIGKHLETYFEPPVSISRSTVYRYLREAGLNTLEKRLAFAGHKTEPRTELANADLEI